MHLRAHGAVGAWPRPAGAPPVPADLRGQLLVVPAEDLYGRRLAAVAAPGGVVAEVAPAVQVHLAAPPAPVLQEPAHVGRLPLARELVPRPRQLPGHLDEGEGGISPGDLGEVSLDVAGVGVEEALRPHPVRLEELLLRRLPVEGHPPLVPPPAHLGPSQVLLLLGPGHRPPQLSGRLPDLGELHGRVRLQQRRTDVEEEEDVTVEVRPWAFRIFEKGRVLATHQLHAEVRASITVDFFLHWCPFPVKLLPLV